MNDYSITRDPETGLQIVRYRGRKIGETQTPAGAALIRRNHRRRLENAVTLTPWVHEPPIPR